MCCERCADTISERNQLKKIEYMGRERDPSGCNGHEHLHDDGNDHRHRGHAHVHAPKDFGWAFAVGTTLNVGIVACLKASIRPRFGDHSRSCLESRAFTIGISGR